MPTLFYIGACSIRSRTHHAFCRQAMNTASSDCKAYELFRIPHCIAYAVKGIYHKVQLKQLNFYIHFNLDLMLFVGF
jgi:hypothetical protein